MKPLAYWKSSTWLAKLLSALPLLLALDILLVGNFYHRMAIDDSLQALANILAAVLLTLAWKKLRREDNAGANGWGFIALATWLYAISSVIFLVVEAIERLPAYPGFADIPRLLFYPVIIAGLLLLPRPRITREGIANTIVDLIAFGLVAAMLVWQINLRHLLQALHAHPNNALRTSLAYAVSDCVLLMVLFFVLIRTMRVGWQLVPILSLLIAGFFLIFSDLVQGYLSIIGETYYSGAAVDLGWMIFYCLLGFAGNCILTRPARPPLDEAQEILLRRRAASWMVAITDAWIGAVLVILIWSLFRHGYMHPAVVIVGLLGAVTLALTRQVRTMHEVTQLYLQVLATNAGLEEKVCERTKQLRESEESLRREKALNDTIFASMPGLLLLYNDQYHLVRTNAWARKILRLEGRDLSTWNQGEGAVEEDRPRAREVVSRVLREGGPEVVEVRAINHDGGPPIPHFFTVVRVMIDGKPHVLSIGQDISAAKKAEEAMRREKAVTDTIFAGMPGILYIYNDQGQLLRTNSRGSQVMGLGGRDLSTWRLGDGVIDEDRDRAQATARKVLEDGGPEVVECRVRTIHGPVPYYFTGVRLMIDDKPHLIAIGFDISKRVKAEQALQRERLLTDAMFADMPGLVYLYDHHGLLRRWNPKMRDILGATDEELSKSYLGDYLRKEDLPWVRQVVEKVMNDGYESIECDLRTPNGWIPYLFTGTRLMIDGQPHLLGEGIDISDRKRAEDTLRREKAFIDAVVQHIPAVLSLYDSDLRLIRWNKRIKELTGFTDEELAKHRAGDAQPPQEREHIQYAADHVLKEGSSVIESTLMTKAGGLIPMYYTGVRVMLDGKAHILTIGVDITERKRHEEQLRAALDRAEAASRAKDRFLAAASHELRTPLAPVMLVTSALERDETLSPDVRHDISMIRENIEIEKRLVGNLLDFTEVSTGMLQLRLVQTDVHELLHSAMRLCQEEISRKGQRWEIQFRAARSRMLADPDRLRQVFVHLLQNASKFSPANSSILVSTSQDGMGAGERLRIEITDSGRGIPPAILPRLFQPFEQGLRDIPEMQHYGGLGLGLAISRAIVEAHGGIIGAASPGVGRGSTFFVDLPLKTEAPAAPSAAKKPATPAVRRLKLLVVEDHPSTLETLEKLLKAEGHEVTTATTLAEAREALDKRDFDLVLTDIGLPDGSGWDLGPILRAHHDLPGIALSGYGAADDLESSRKAGFITHLTKPVTVHTLREALASIPPRSVGAA